MEPDSVSTDEGKSKTLRSTPFPKVFFKTPEMEITINNKLKTLTAPQPITVQQLINQEIPERQQGIAIAINNRVIAKAEWQQTTIAHKDEVTIIRATQGG